VLIVFLDGLGKIGWLLKDTMRHNIDFIGGPDQDVILWLLKQVLMNLEETIYSYPHILSNARPIRYQRHIDLADCLFVSNP
jgi:hypothetical protein